MKNTALTHIHEGLGAKMLPFAGYNMPILYEGVNAEHRSEEHTSELQSHHDLVCRLLLEKKKKL